MIDLILKKIFGTKHERDVKRVQPRVAAINALEANLQRLDDAALVATLPAYLNALPGKGVHIVTVNDYLAKRDAQWMRPLYQALGLSVGVIQHEASFFYDPTYVTSDIRMT